MKTLKLDCEIGYRTGDGAWYRTIGPDSVSDFLATCAPGERVKIEINSPGGAVIETEPTNGEEDDENP
jgi:hypothetical protein